MAPSSEDEYEVLRPHFTGKAWLALSNYEKLRFSNIKQNYEMMIEIGLDVPLPEFMRPRKNTIKRRLKDEVDDGNNDEEWLPVKKPVPHPGKVTVRSSTSDRKEPKSSSRPKKEGNKTGRKSATDEVTKIKKPKRAPRQTSKPPGRCYPKRSQPKKCYKEEEVPDDDHFIYCEDCGEFYDASCPKHPLTIVEDLPVGPRCKNKARKSLPNGLAIRESSISGAGFGVFAEQLFNKGVRFGPYTGETVDGAAAFSSGYAWEICSSGKAAHYVNARNEAKSNWMRFVNCARNENEQNLVAFQYYGQIYYRAFKAIPPGAELLVYYGKDYAHDLGIERVFSSDHKKVDVTQGGSSVECQECGRLFTIHIYLLKHLKYSHGHSIYFPRESNTPNRGIMSTQGIRYVIASKMLSTLDERTRRTKPVNELPAKNSQSGVELLACSDSSIGDNLCTTSGESPNESPRTTDVTSVCDTCGTSIMQQEKLEIDDCAASSVRQCNTCEKSSTQSSRAGSLKEHGEVHSGVKTYQCKTCGKSFTLGGDMRRHEQIHSGVKPYRCKTCGKSFTQSHNLKRHKQIHSGDTPYQCKTCGKPFKLSHHLKRHERIHSGDTPYQCKTCGKSFTRSDILREHERIHSGAKPYQCKTCGKSFTRSDILRIHERIHSCAKPYQCKTCGKSFTQSSSLRGHERIHSGAKPYQCKTCGKSFTQSSNLRGHERIHSGAKPYQCKTCGKSFTQSSNLREHERIHSGAKPYQCKTCGKSFTQSRSLREHERIHSRAKPYQCKTCGKPFKLSHHLKRHERIHSGDTPYQCKTCGKSFTQSSSLRAHVACAHSPVTPHHGGPHKSPGTLPLPAKQMEQSNEQ